MSAVLLLVLIAQPADDPHSNAASVFTSSHRHNDDKECRYGTDIDYWWVYDSANTQIELNTTNSDGSGTDAVACFIDDGTNYLAFGASTADAVGVSADGVFGLQKLSDVAPQGLMLRSQPAFAGGTQTASNVLLCGGQDESTVGIDGADPTVTCAGANDTVTVTVTDSNGTQTATVLTGDVDWTVVASVATTCANLATAINNIAGVGATCTSPNVRITLDTNTCMVTLAESTAACTTVGVGTAGFFSLARGGSQGAPGLAIAGDADTGLFSAGANQIGITGGAATVLSYNGTSTTQGTATSFSSTTAFVGVATAATDTSALCVGTSNNACFEYLTTDTPDTAKLLPPSTSNAIVMIGRSNGATDYAHALQTNPTLFIQSITTTTNQWLSLAHNQTDAVIGSGSGDLGIIDDGGKGVTTYIRTNTEVLTFAANPGDASKVTSALCPVGVPIMGITTRVRTTATNCTSVQIGDGTDADMFSSATSAITAGTTTGPANYTAYSRIGVGQAAFNVTVTANGGNCFTGVWAVTCHYIDPVAATAN